MLLQSPQIREFLKKQKNFVNNLTTLYEDSSNSKGASYLVEVILNTAQSKQFATAIYKDIAEYIQNHKEEYEKFLKNEKRLEVQDKQ